MEWVVKGYKKSTIMDKSWIKIRNRRSTKCIQGVGNFMVMKRNHTDSLNRIRCPCCSCNNVLFQHIDDVEMHLYAHEFDSMYTEWVHHAETTHESLNREDDWCVDM